MIYFSYSSKESPVHYSCTMHVHNSTCDFRVAFRLCFKASPIVRSLHMEISLIHTQILVHLISNQYMCHKNVIWFHGDSNFSLNLR